MRDPFRSAEKQGGRLRFFEAPARQNPGAMKRILKNSVGTVKGACGQYFVPSGQYFTNLGQYLLPRGQ